MFERRGEGQSIVEFALLLPVLLILLLGLLDLGRVWYAVVTLRDCASEGATYAAIRPLDEDGIRARAAAASGGLVQITPDMVQVYRPNPLTAGAPITVTVSYTFTFLNPLTSAAVPDGHIVIGGTATEPVISTP